LLLPWVLKYWFKNWASTRLCCSSSNWVRSVMQCRRELEPRTCQWKPMGLGVCCQRVTLPITWGTYPNEIQNWDPEVTLTGTWSYIHSHDCGTLTAVLVTWRDIQHVQPLQGILNNGHVFD
jgi:hypothetical protein